MINSKLAEALITAKKEYEKILEDLDEIDACGFVINFDELVRHIFDLEPTSDIPLLKLIPEENWTTDIVSFACTFDSRNFNFIKDDYPLGLEEEVLKIDGLAIKYLPEEEQNENLCKIAVTQNGEALQYIKHQTDDIIYAALDNNPESLYYVKKQKHSHCLYAVERDGDVLEYVEDPTLEICIAAVNQTESAMRFVPEEYQEQCQKCI